jgi:hypothetical protein
MFGFDCIDGHFVHCIFEHVRKESWEDPILVYRDKDLLCHRGARPRFFFSILPLTYWIGLETDQLLPHHPFFFVYRFYD